MGKTRYVFTQQFIPQGAQAQKEIGPLNVMKSQSSNGSDAETKQPVHEVVYLTLREQILFGDMAPGQAVTIQGLSQTVGAGMTPVREAIRRLISDGALVFQGNRRVSVPKLSLKDVEQLIFLRKSIEPELTRRAAEFITDKGIAVLEGLDVQLDAAISAGDVSGYLRSNYEFHAYLYEQGRSPILTELTDRLWLRFGPSLRVVCGRFGTQNLPDRHKELLAALRAKSPGQAAAAMAQDVEQGMLQVRELLQESGQAE